MTPIRTKLHQRTRLLLIVALVVSLFDVALLLGHAKSETPFFYIEFRNLIVRKDPAVPSRLIPVWRNNAWFAEGPKQMTAKDLIKLEPYQPPDRSCSVMYRLTDNATLADLTKSLDAAWAAGATVLIVAPSIYKQFDPDIVGIVYAAPYDKRGECPERI